jgi:hypothetical protein
VNALDGFNGNVKRTAEHYGREVKQIYRWIEHYTIDLELIRRPQ